MATGSSHHPASRHRSNVYSWSPFARTVRSGSFTPSPKTSGRRPGTARTPGPSTSVRCSSTCRAQTASHGPSSPWRCGRLALSRSTTACCLPTPATRGFFDVVELALQPVADRRGDHHAEELQRGGQRRRVPCPLKQAFPSSLSLQFRGRILATIFRTLQVRPNPTHAARVLWHADICHG